MSGHFGGAPRPWRASPNNTNACSTVHDAEGIRIGTADSRHAGMDAPAIAILFAAAPELADALEALFRDIDTQLRGGRATGYLQHVQDARTALAKAGRLP